MQLIYVFKETATILRGFDTFVIANGGVQEEKSRLVAENFLC